MLKTILKQTNLYKGGEELKLNYFFKVYLLQLEHLEENWEL
jgi:hypothetical protein